MTLSNLFSHRSFVYSLCFLAFTIPLYIKLNSVAIIIAAAVGLGYFIFNREEWKAKKKNYIPLLLFGGLYLGAVVGLLNSSSAPPALFDLEQKLSWLIFPFIFFLGSQPSRKEVGWIILSFISSLTLVSLVSMFTEGFQILTGAPAWKGWWGSPLPIDRIYLGTYLCFAMMALCFLYLMQASGKKKIIFSIWIILLLVALFNTLAKTSLTTVLALFLVFGFRFLYKRNRCLLGGAAILSIIALALFIKSNKGSMMVNAILYQKAIDSTETNHLLSDSFNARTLTWQCAIDVLSSANHWFMGIGTGDAQLALDDCYYANKLKITTPYFLEARLNPHNEYFSLWLNYGLLFLILFLFQLIYYLSLFYRQALMLGISFIVIIVFSCLTESFLETQKGIVFYAFFCSLLPFASPTNPKC